MPFYGGYAGWPVDGRDRTDGECGGFVKPRGCYRCGRVDTLRVWHVRFIERSAWSHWPEGVELYASAQVRCADEAACEALVEERERKDRERKERRHPQLPNRNARAGHCKWCGDPIELDKRRKGWRRRRMREYHRGDEWERAGQPTDCVERAIAWRSPQRALDILLERQGGRCAVCGYQLARQVTYYDSYEGRDVTYWSVTTPPEALSYQLPRGVELPPGMRRRYRWLERGADVDHERALADGGDNSLENLRAICNRPCHTEKTAREARERARRRRAGRGQLELAGTEG